MTDTQRITTIETEGRRTIECAREDPGRAVLQYPEWSLRDLVLHVASVHGRTSEIIRTRSTERAATPELPTDADPMAWSSAQLASVVDALATADLETEVWTPVSDSRIAFWERRMVIETGLHRWDAEIAMGSGRPLDPLVATDGLDEIPLMYLHRLGEVPPIELVATDLDRSWRYGDGDPTAVIEGTASDLYLRLMSRPGSTLPVEWEQAVDALGSPAS